MNFFYIYNVWMENTRCILQLSFCYYFNYCYVVVLVTVEVVVSVQQKLTFNNYKMCLTLLKIVCTYMYIYI